MPLFTCPACACAVLPGGAACPHCAAPLPAGPGALPRSVAALALGLGLALTGCKKEVAALYGAPPADLYDADGDGFTPGDGDCDDGDAGVHPGAVEAEGDGVDQDCDGVD